MPTRRGSRRKPKVSEEEYKSDTSETGTESESCGSVVTEESDDVKDTIQEIVDDLIDFVSIHPDMTSDGKDMSFISLMSRSQELDFSKALFKK